MLKCMIDQGHFMVCRGAESANLLPSRVFALTSKRSGVNLARSPEAAIPSAAAAWQAASPGSSEHSLGDSSCRIDGRGNRRGIGGVSRCAVRARDVGDGA